jgi:hypothetical protein
VSDELPASGLTALAAGANIFNKCEEIESVMFLLNLSGF